MSMIQAAYHLNEASTALAEAGRLIDVARHHVADAKPHDPDLKGAGGVYDVLEENLPLMASNALLSRLWCIGLVMSRQPDIDRETEAIDAEREAATI